MQRVPRENFGRYGVSSLGPRRLAPPPPQLLSDGEFPRPISTHRSGVVHNCDLTDWHAGSHTLVKTS